MRIVGILAAAALAGFSSTADADTWHVANIANIYPLSTGNFVLIFDEDHAACTSASSPDYYRAFLGENGMTGEGLRVLYAAALSAAAAGLPIKINFDETSSGCYINRLQEVY